MNDLNNEKALKILEQQYGKFINLEGWDFFRGLAGYVETAENLTAVKPIIEALEKQREVARIVYEQMNTEAFKELTKSAEQIQGIANEVAERYEPVAAAAKRLQEQLNGEILSTEPLNRFNEIIFDVARRLRESGLAESIKKYEDNQKEIKNIYGNYTFSPTYEKLESEKISLKRQDDIMPWGAWQHLPLAKRVIFEPDKFSKELKQEAKTETPKIWSLLNLLGAIDEMEEIRSDEISDDDIAYFKVKDFRSFAQRVHNFITTELLQKADKVDFGKLEFDPKTSILSFAGATITISARAQNDPHDLLRTIFQDKTKLWNTDEVLTDWHFDFGKEAPKNKVYHAGKAVNRIVYSDTQIKDFLIVNTKTVAINKKYLPD